MVELVILLNLALHTQPSFAELGDERSAREEFELKRQMSQSRIEDFYRRMIELDRLDAQRRMGENDMRKTRKVRVQEYEQTRKEFVKSRRSKPVPSSREWEEELRQKKLRHEAARKDYVRRKKELDRLMSRLGKIPEEDEYEIDLNWQEELERDYKYEGR